MQKVFVTFAVLLVAAEGISLLRKASFPDASLLLSNLDEASISEYPPKQCNEESLYEPTPRCEELCNAPRDLQIKLLAPKKYSCAAFWASNFQSDEECEQNATQARMKMLDALCGEGGICHEAEQTEKSSKTRGIVFTARRSNWYLVHKTLNLLGTLAQDTTPLPAEILVDKEELLSQCERSFEGLAKCIAPKRKPADLVAMGARGQYGYKGMALLESSFDEVLFLDDDVVPVHHPGVLFESCEFQRTGALFMPDIFGHACQDSFEDPGQNKVMQAWGQSAWPEHAMWSVTGAKWEAKWPLAQEFETGAMLVDKTRHLKALKLALHFIESPEVQKMMYGDKDCFKHAFVALGESYALSSDRPTQLLISNLQHPKEYNRIGELQRMMGRYMFTHHLPRTLENVVTSAGHGSNNPTQQVALVAPRSREGKQAYSYCPDGYGTYSAKESKGRNYWFACFPKGNLTCPEEEFGPPTGMLKDAVKALQYLSQKGF